MEELEQKYYTPEIEEFHVGFEYELKDFYDDYVTATFEKTQVETHDFLGSISNWLDLGEVRVKYLDQEDIENLGWKQTEQSDKYLLMFTKITKNIVSGESEEMALSYSVKQKHMIVYLYRGGNPPITFIFRGRIKNKSELKVLMKQLGIC